MLIGPLIVFCKLKFKLHFRIWLHSAEIWKIGHVTQLDFRLLYNQIDTL